MRMGLLDHFKKSDPTWLSPVQDFCKSNGISIAAWGPKSLVVVAKTPEKSAEIAALLASFGFKPQEDPNDAYAGLLTLSREDS